MILSRNTSGFTLVEMVLSTTIFAIMSVIVLSIYIQTTTLSARLKATRYLSETSRQITETLAEEVQNSGLSGSYNIPSSPYIFWNGSSSYTESGSEILASSDTRRIYIYGKKTNTGIDPCTDADKADVQIHCGLYLVKDENFALAWNLVDSFIPEESKKRVKIADIKFYISGDGNTSEQKVTIVLNLVLMPRIGVPNMEASASSLRVQTTISERFFKQNQ